MGNKNKIKFYDESYLGKKLGLTRREFHRYIKPIIKSDFQAELKQYDIENPDIGLDQDDNLYLADANHIIIIATEVNISIYLNNE